MNPTSPLDQLRDIHLPADIDWWPIATSLWILVAVTTILAATILFAIIRHHRKNAWRRTALSNLKALRSAQNDYDNAGFASQLGILVKRCLISSDQTKSNALSASENQLAQLLKLSAGKQTLPEKIVNTLSYEVYKTECPSISKNDLTYIEKWIKGLRNA